LIPEQETRMTSEPVAAEAGRDFIRDIVQADLDAKD
jgi:glutaminyl-tRNA synthetase